MCSASTTRPVSDATRIRPADAEWWRQAVVYQIYPRSFADADGNGLGDLAGVISRIPYLASLGIDAVWLSPFYPSALTDGGYDVDDYRDVDPRLGTLADFDEMTARLHARRIKVIVDIVPNHTSSRHAWFREALAAPKGSPARNRYIFRDGLGPDGSQPPSDWALRVRRASLGPRPRRPVVPAPVRRGAAGPELGQPRGPRRLPQDAPVLVRPRGRRVPRRRGARPGQEPGRAARVAARRGGHHRRVTAARHAPAVGPGRGARHLRRMAAGLQRIRSAAGRSGRGLGAPLPAAEVRQPRRAGTGLQLRPARSELERRRVPARHHRQPLRCTAAGIVHDVGAVQPRRGTARDPLRAAARGTPRARARQELAAERRYLPSTGARPGSAAGPGRGPDHAGPAGLRVPVPG